MSIRITSGPAVVLHQGMATTFAGHPLLLGFDIDDEVEIAVVLGFSSDPSAPGLEVRSTWDRGVLVLDLVNFDSPDGRGSAQPVLLGAVGDDLLFFHFRVFRYGETLDHTVHFTFYRVAKDAVGWTPSEQA